MENFPTKDQLHTDVLEKKYGKIHAEVLRHDNVREAQDRECIREARLVDEENILRTYALTFLTYDRKNEEMLKIDGEIRQGGLIGETFRKHGYVVKKNVIDVFLLNLPDWMKADFKTEEEKAKARLTEFYAKKENAEPIIYGTVSEIYSPDFRDPKDGINEVDKAQVNPVTDTLEQVGIPVQEVWQRLDRAHMPNEWDDLKGQYEQSRKLSEPIIEQLHSKIDKYLQDKA